MQINDSSLFAESVPMQTLRHRGYFPNASSTTLNAVSTLAIGLILPAKISQFQLLNFGITLFADMDSLLQTYSAASDDWSFLK